MLLAFRNNPELRKRSKPLQQQKMIDFQGKTSKCLSEVAFLFFGLEFILPVLAAQEELRVQILRVFCLRNTLYNFGFYFGKSHVELWLLVSSGTDKIRGEWTTECRQERPKSNRRPLQTISPRQATQMLSETVFKTFIRSISWEEIEF